MELKRLEQLAALENRIDTATEKLKVDIKIGLMDTAQAIEEIKLQLQEIEAQKGKGGAN
ncbi:MULTISPECIES: hypothetical protein [unclassified Microcoleus]|uniref:hypothetical protein n=1 Tax=unclassified Microcoleus TaxID=2642155 RepID=UPI002FD3A821